MLQGHVLAWKTDAPLRGLNSSRIFTTSHFQPSAILRFLMSMGHPQLPQYTRFLMLMAHPQPPDYMRFLVFPDHSQPPRIHVFSRVSGPSAASAMHTFSRFRINRNTCRNWARQIQAGGSPRIRLSCSRVAAPWAGMREGESPHAAGAT